MLIEFSNVLPRADGGFGFAIDAVLSGFYGEKELFAYSNKLLFSFLASHSADILSGKHRRMAERRSSGLWEPSVRDDPLMS